MTSPTPTPTSAPPTSVPLVSVLTPAPTSAPTSTPTSTGRHNSAPVPGFGNGSIVGQTSAQSARRLAVVKLWMGGATYSEIRKALNIGSDLTVQRDIEFSKDILVERFAGEVNDNKVIALQRLEYIVEKMMDSMSGSVAVSISDKVKISNAIMKAVELGAKINGVLDGTKHSSNEKGPKPVLYVMSPQEVEVKAEDETTNGTTEVKTTEVGITDTPLPPRQSLDTNAE